MRHVGRTLTGAALISLITLAGCAATNTSTESGFTYKNLPVAKETVQAGVGSSVNFRGTALLLTGPGIKEGDALRHVKVTTGDLSLLDIAETQGKVRIINIVPSLDTTVCEQQTHYLSEKNKGLDQSIELVTVSVDTPFAQGRFAKEAKIDNVAFLSDYRGGEFGKTYGLLLEGSHVLARSVSVMVVDKHNVLRYLQVTPDLAHMPDMEAAFQAARALVGQG